MFGHLLLFRLSYGLVLPSVYPLPGAPHMPWSSPNRVIRLMAEGDTVLATAVRLHEALAGQVLTRTDLRVPRFATADLSGQAVRDVVSRGKHLLVRTDGEVSVHSHLGMDGAWRLYGRGERWRGRAFEVRGCSRRSACGRRPSTATPRGAPDVGGADVLRDLGPDVLGPDWDAAEATRRLTASPERAVGDALIDQSVMAGPGNVFRSEVCFLAGIDPRTAGGLLTAPGGSST